MRGSAVSTSSRAQPPDRLRRIEPAAVAGVLSREWTVFTRYWVSTTFSSIVEPTIYLLAFGFGLGVLLPAIGGLDYLDFIGTGIVATAVMFSSAFPGMFGTFVKRRFQRTYDAILAAPVDTGELVTAEALWLSLRAGVYGCAPMIVAIFFGLDPSPGMLLVPFIAALTGFGFASLGILIAGIARSIDNFNYVISAVLTPLFLVAGTFFPVDVLPAPVAAASVLNPLYHCVELVRGAVFGFSGWGQLGHVAGLVVFGAVAWALAIRRLRARLID
ncbi:ABC transporter [Egibacter rhizosphaerae]|uniref:Transport permease protein n=1 Tax=Egibacter rhizosphaerae TaxID=1670831 RepID=A0A411YKG2_9ACTN|nr:ABC transporter permease [Egibacter rhizosphaerae]QBI21670.1 ABC transporter [Egibacter rhizosphaerae]